MTIFLVYCQSLHNLQTRPQLISLKSQAKSKKMMKKLIPNKPFPKMNSLRSS